MPWGERQTIDLSIAELPFDEDKNSKSIDFSKLRVTVAGRKSPHDLGALCYIKRRRKQAHSSQKGYTVWQVNPQTLCSKRKMAIQQFSKYIYSLHCFGKSSKTILNIIRILIDFIQWCDQHYPNVFSTSIDSQKAYSLYTQMLRDAIRKNMLHVNTAAMKQRITATILNAIYDDKQGSITSGIKKIRVNKFAANNTTAPSEEIAQQAISLYTHLFTGISTFLLNFEHYPFHMKLPNESVWVFPGQIPFATQSMLANRDKRRNASWGWNYKKGEIATYESIREHYKGMAHTKIAINNAKQLLKNANQHCQHPARLKLAALAIQCFTMLFIANTAMNISPLSQLSWETEADFEYIKSSKQGFKTIKHRAGGAIVEFHITNNFLPYFIKYLKLRKWILHDSKAPLFFMLDKQWHPKKIDNSLATKLRIKLNKFGLELPSARQWRAYKADWLIRKTDLQTTALLLQNSKETVLQHYITGSKVRADEEMTAFLNKMHLKVIKSGVSSAVEINIGRCREYEVPKSESVQNTIQPNCYQPEGCLFCINYQVHADEYDIRKLCSCRYVIVETRTLAGSAAHFVEVFEPILNRIDTLLKYISSMNDTLKQIVDRVKHEVMEEGKLTSYWRLKLQMLVELETI